MASMMGVGLLLIVLMVSVCEAGEYCYSYGNIYSTYCVYGCCGYGNQECCTGSIGLIVGLCVGGAVFLFFIILTICLCRRRRYGGFIYRSQPAALVVQQSNVASQNGVVSTAGVPPGVVYPPYPQYQYPGNTYPTAPMSAPPYAPAYQGVTEYPYQPTPYAAEPPKYDSLNFDTDGGVTNQGFDRKN